MGLIPRSIIQKRWHEAIKGLEAGTLTFVDPAGERVVVQGPVDGPAATFKIHDWGVIERVIARGDIGLGEDYIAGAWETDSVERLISLFLINLDRLDGYAHGNVWNRLGFVLLNTVLRRNSEAGSSRNIKAHYDVGNDFYSLWLDETMTYSSALFRAEDDSLADAQRNKYARILERIGPSRARILEVGCGWGGFAEMACGANHDVTGITVSPAQHDFATQRLAGRAEVRLEDYRRTQGTYDALVSIEMFEAVGEKYWPRYFNVLSERLKRGGRAVLQIITIRDDLFGGYRTRSDFIRQYVFPGGMLPSLSQVTQHADRAGLKTVSIHAFGHDYARTLRSWSNRFQSAEDKIRALSHGDPFLRNWQFYFGICAAAFAVNRTNVVQVELANA
jgi:cyclopropane-fatty-acyl-phospholipid synthase